MASLRSSPSVLFISILHLFISLFSPVHSLTCTSQKLISSNHVFSNCTHLPQLNAYLHYSYDASNSSLSVAYMAPPAKPNGWISWGINPPGEGMLGAQALIAHKLNCKVVVNTYNISSYSNVMVSKLSFDVWDVSAEESSDGTIAIFTTLKVPEKVEELNHVWQAGSSVFNGKPYKHGLAQANLNSKGVLRVASAVENTSGTGGHSGGASVMREGNGLGVFEFVFVFSERRVILFSSLVKTLLTLFFFFQ